MRRLLLLLVIFIAAGCASTPAGKMAWSLEPEPGPSESSNHDSPLTPTLSPAGGEGGRPALSVASPEATRSRRAAAGWTDAALLAFGSDEPYLPPVANPAPEKLAAEAPAGPPLDAALLRFAADARLRRTVLPHSHTFPPDAVVAWQGLARELEHYLERPMPQTPLAELVRARVAVEAELDFDRRRFGEPPPEIALALREDLTHLARRAEAARALGQTIFVATRPPVLRWPIMDAGLSSTFGLRLHPIDHVRRMHWGVDFSAATGRVVSASARGFVVRAGYTPGYGLAVEVRHDGELTSRYGHLSRLLCASGDRIDAGQPIGLVGSTGRSTGPHLHFEVWRGGRAEDPLVLLGARWSGSAGGGG